MPFAAQSSNELSTPRRSLFIFLLFSLCHLSRASLAAEKFRLSHYYIGGAILPFWVIPEQSKKVLAKYLRLKDRDIIEENYRFNSGQLLESVPSIPLEGLRYAVESLIPTVPAAKNLKAEAMIDTSILEEAAAR